MPQVINTNIASLNAQRQLNRTQTGRDTAMERLSSGLRINSAKDDAAGLGIVDRMTAQIKGLNQAARNANDGISLAQVAEGALQESTNILQRLRELAIQSSNDTNSASDRANIQKEVVQLKAEIDRIAESTSFNGKELLNGSFISQKFHVGAFANESITVNVGNARTDAIGSNDINTAALGDSAVAPATALPASPVSASEDLTLRGSLGAADISIDAGDSYKTIAGKINAAAENTGINAKSESKALISGVTTAGSLSLILKGKNTNDVNISAAITPSNLTDLVTAINDQQASTGITAELSADKKSITLTSERGDGIKMVDVSVSSYTAASTSEIFKFAGIDVSGTATTAVSITNVNDSSRVEGFIKITSVEPFSIIPKAAGSLFDNTKTQISTLIKVSDIDVSTQKSSNDAINVIDGALQKISNTRGDLGAIQNRFLLTISNLENVSQNVSASRSRVLDADFAQESARLARAQILQQAGVSMLAQANQSTQSVLSLLQQ